MPVDIMYVCVPVATFVYVLVDVNAVIGSVPALLRSMAFWLLWLLFSIFNAVAFVLFKTTTHSIAGLDPAHSPAANFLVLFFSTIGTFSIIQSFSLKFADYKAIDLEQMFEKLRAQVLSDAASEKAGLEKSRKIRLAQLPVLHYSTHPGNIDNDYLSLMTFGSRLPQDIQAEIAAARIDPDQKVSVLVYRMVLVDERGARNFLP